MLRGVAELAHVRSHDVVALAAHHAAAAGPVLHKRVSRESEVRYWGAAQQLTMIPPSIAA